MSTIDIRTPMLESRITSIIFADEEVTLTTAIELQDGSRFVYIAENNGGDGGDTVRVRKSDIPNLIKALEKAVELGWTA